MIVIMTCQKSEPGTFPVTSLLPGPFQPGRGNDFIKSKEGQKHSHMKEKYPVMGKDDILSRTR